MDKSPFNNPFAELKLRLKQTGLPEAVPPAQTSQTANTEHPAPQDEALLFAQAMQGVSGLEKVGGRVIPKKNATEVDRYVPVDEDLEVMAHLAELVGGQENICLSWHKDFVRGSNSKINPQLLQALEQGLFPIQDYIDLHGLGAEEALRQVEDFLQQSRAKGLRHVLIVHGKGKNSSGGESVLKETLSRSLCHKRFARWVLAFSNALSQDGGTGAMYVLLKTWQGPTIFASNTSK